jgi:hypothetical protein
MFVGFRGRHVVAARKTIRFCEWGPRFRAFDRGGGWGSFSSLWGRCVKAKNHARRSDSGLASSGPGAVKRLRSRGFDRIAESGASGELRKVRNIRRSA